MCKFHMCKHILWVNHFQVKAMRTILWPWHFDLDVITLFHKHIQFPLAGRIDRLAHRRTSKGCVLDGCVRGLRTVTVVSTVPVSFLVLVSRFIQSHNVKYIYRNKNRCHPITEVQLTCFRQTAVGVSEREGRPGNPERMCQMLLALPMSCSVPSVATYLCQQVC